MPRAIKKIEINYGHVLPNHYSFCSQLHGHLAIVEAMVEGDICETEGDSNQGMVLDFKHLKRIMKSKIYDILDHGFAIWKDDPDLDFICKRNSRVLVTDMPPTAEYLAKWAYGEIEKELPQNIELVSVKWQETPRSLAEYSGS